MKSIEINKELKMNYEELVNHLLNKYGVAKYDYFCNETCRSRDPKNSRTKEGLFLHHIDEDKAFQLSVDRFASMQSYEYQKANRLVYCNVLEHLMLHIKIIEKTINSNVDLKQIHGIGGAVTFIYPQINDYYNGFEFQQEYLINIYSLIKNNYKDYIKILKHFLEVVNGDPLYSLIINKKSLSFGFDGRVIDKIYNSL